MRRLISVAAVAACAALSVVPVSATPAAAADTVLWEGGWEDGAIPPYSSSPVSGGARHADNEYYDVQMDGNTVAGMPSFALQNAVTRDGSSGRALRITYGDGFRRAQFRADYPAFRATGDGNDNEYWAGFSVMFGPGYSLSEMSSSRYHNIWGWRQFGSGGASVYLTIEKGDGTVVLRRSTGGDGYVDGNTANRQEGGKCQIGKWCDIVVHTKLSTTSKNALREFWVNGVHSGRMTDANVSTTTDPLWMRIGPYSAERTGSHTIYFDNARLGTSFAAVNPSRTGASAPSAEPAPAPEPDVAPTTPVPAPAPAPEPAPVVTAPTTTTSTTSAQPTFVGATHGDSGTTTEETSVVLRAPAATKPGTVLLAAMSMRGRPTVTPPAGWSLLTSQLHSANMLTQVYRYVCPASGCTDGQAWTWKKSSANGVSAVLAAYNGVDVQRLSVAAQNNTTSATTSVAPALGAVSARTLVVTVHGMTGTAHHTAPSGMLARSSQMDGDGAYRSSIGLSDVVQSVSGATGTKTATFSVKGQSTGVTIALPSLG